MAFPVGELLIKFICSALIFDLLVMILWVISAQTRLYAVLYFVPFVD